MPLPEGRVALVVNTSLDCGAVAELYRRAGWDVRRHRSGGFAIGAAWADLELEREGPSSLLLHGAISDPVTNGDRVVEPLHGARIPFWGEAYDEADREARAWGRPGDGGPRHLVGRMLTAAAPLHTLYDKHLRDNVELLPHVFFGDVTRFVVSGFANHPETRGDAEKILALLEDAMDVPDQDVQNLISVSFCENLLGERPLEAIRSVMGPRLRAELAKYERT